MTVRLIIVTFVFVFSSLAEAEELLTFNDKQQEERYKVLITELRCPKCLNQSIADSDAGISEDLRNLVYEQILEGKTTEQIKVFLQQRYGDFILYKPSKTGFNLVLWIGPLVAMLGVFVWLILWIKGRSSSQPVPLSDNERAKLGELLRPDDEASLTFEQSKSKD